MRADVDNLLSRLVPRVEIVEHVVHGKSILPEIQIFRKELSRNLWAPARLRELLKRDPKRVRRFLKDQREKLTGVAKREATKYLIGAELDCLVASLLAMRLGRHGLPSADRMKVFTPQQTRRAESLARRGAP